MLLFVQWAEAERNLHAICPPLEGPACRRVRVLGAYTTYGQKGGTRKSIDDDTMQDENENNT